MFKKIAVLSVVLLFWWTTIFSQNQIGADLDGESSGDFSGWSVSMSSDGTRIIIGAYLNDDGGSNAGHARVYSLSGGTWSPLGNDLNGEASSDLSGRSVAISPDGSRVAVGAIFNDGNGSSAGHVRVYSWNGSSWIQEGNDIDGEAASDQSGYSVSLSLDGSRVAVGAPFNDGNGADAGHVRVYELSGATWVQLGADIDGEALNDRLGYSLSLSSDGDRLAVGAYLNDGNGSNSGHTQIYEWSGSSWDLLGSDINGEFANDWSGYSVSLSSDGSTVAIGAPTNDGNGGSSGHTRIYNWNGANWVQLGTDIDGEAASDQSGYSVSISSDGTKVAIGAPFNDGTPSNGGHTRVFEWNGSSWLQVGSDINGESSDDQSGYAVSLSSDGTSLGIGGNLNDGNGSNSGHTRVYNMVIALPVELISFTAKADLNDVSLTWTTASEVNNSGFWIQKSKNGEDWKSLGFVNGHGTTNYIINYNFTDPTPISNMNYYRLKQVDFDGIFEYSEVVQIQFSQTRQVKTYPNPAKNRIHLPGMEDTEIEIVNQQGRTIKKTRIAYSQIDISELPTGIYYIKTHLNEQPLTWKFIKE